MSWVFMTKKQQSSWKSVIYSIDKDYAGDLALLSHYVEQSQLFLTRLKAAGEAVGWHANHIKKWSTLCTVPVKRLDTLTNG